MHCYIILLHPKLVAIIIQILLLFQNQGILHHPNPAVNLLGKLVSRIVSLMSDFLCISTHKHHISYKVGGVRVTEHTFA